MVARACPFNFLSRKGAKNAKATPDRAPQQPRRGGLSLTPGKRSAARGEGRWVVQTQRLEDARSTKCAYPYLSQRRKERKGMSPPHRGMPWGTFIVCKPLGAFIGGAMGIPPLRSEALGGDSLPLPSYKRWQRRSPQSRRGSLLVLSTRLIQHSWQLSR